MGKVASIMKRPLRDFNLESRVFKVLSKEKPTPAPKYTRDKVSHETMLKEYPKEFEESLKKNKNLDQHLKAVFVTSLDPKPEPPPDSSSAKRPLPLDKSVVLESEFGFREPKTVPYGRVTLKSALKFIQNHQLDPVNHSISKIALDFKLPEDVVANVVKYNRIYEIYVPTKGKPKVNFIGPLVKRTEVVTHPGPKKLTGGKKTDKE